jgi:hypothetical protein
LAEGENVVQVARRRKLGWRAVLKLVRETVAKIRVRLGHEE